MATKWTRVAKGVRYREHESRKHGVRFDRYYALSYWLKGEGEDKGKTINEAVGWASNGVTQTHCEELLRTLKINQKKGTGPQTLADMREANLEQAAKEKAEKQKVASLTLHGIFFDGYLAKQNGNKAQATIAKEQGRMNNYIAPFFGETSIYNIDARMMDKFLDYLNNQKSKHTNKPLSAQTKKHIINNVSQIFNYAISRIDSTLQNPVRLIKKPSTKSAERERFLTKAEAKALLDALAERSLNTHDMALLSLFCGLRAGEIMRLTWQDINFSEQTLFLRDTKNKKNRHSYFTPEVEVMLRARYGEQALNEKVFPNTEISKTFERVVKDLGLNTGITDNRDKVVFHTLRHTFASWLVSAGVPLHAIGKMLGHSSSAMVDRYSHLCPDAKKQATSILHGLLNDSQSNLLQFKQAQG